MNLNQVTVGCTNQSKSIEFYKKLGLQLIVHTHEGYARFLCPNGESTFSIHTVEKVPASTTWIYFECEIDKTYSTLIHKGITFEHSPIMQPWLWKEARLKDPDGNVIILYEAGANRVNPPWRK